MTASIPTPTRLSPIRDDHVWRYPTTENRTRVRLRVWPCEDGGHLAIVTDLLAGASVVNSAISLYETLTAEYGKVCVVQHYPAGTFVERERDRFSKITLNEEGKPVWHPCEREIVELLGVRVLGYPGDEPPGPADADQPRIPPASVHLATLLAASLRLEADAAAKRQDMDAETVLTLTTRALGGIASIVRNADIGPGEYLPDELDAELDRIGDRLARIADDLDQLQVKIRCHRRDIPIPGPGLRERVRRVIES